MFEWLFMPSTASYIGMFSAIILSTLMVYMGIDAIVRKIK